ncbi:hypothetical protein CEXT_508721 [Caerostris extrusa]|uniref:Uncharacterized protein n=1 Tax=Caerostris extrusa TaxID=172846 RepID=A0AAV4T9Y0_CAEEX|nr:hypothetical protein CEXT_508721 [Caerostris extrusa]
MWSFILPIVLFAAAITENLRCLNETFRTSTCIGDVRYDLVNNGVKIDDGEEQDAEVDCIDGYRKCELGCLFDELYEQGGNTHISETLTLAGYSHGDLLLDDIETKCGNLVGEAALKSLPAPSTLNYLVGMTA